VPRERWSQVDINVTPLVDVMLVLLIIMMLVAPMLQQGVSVRLPWAQNTVDKPDQQGQTVLIQIGLERAGVEQEGRSSCARLLIS
jgi:biopolymer transport protein ExbD